MELDSSPLASLVCFATSDFRLTTTYYCMILLLSVVVPTTSIAIANRDKS